MKLNNTFYQRATIGSVWTILALILLNGMFFLGVDVDYWTLSLYAVFLIIAMLRWKEY